MGNVKRIGIGLATSIVILLVLDLLPSPIPSAYVSYQLLDHFYIWPGVGGMITMFVAALGGAYVSKTRFVVPAVLLAVGGWIFVIYVLNSIAVVAGQDNLFVVASTNLPGLIFGAVGAAMGALTGMRLVERFSRSG